MRFGVYVLVLYIKLPNVILWCDGTEVFATLSTVAVILNIICNMSLHWLYIYCTYLTRYWHMWFRQQQYTFIVLSYPYVTYALRIFHIILVIHFIMEYRFY